MVNRKKRRYHCMPNAELYCVAAFFAFVALAIWFHSTKGSNEWLKMVLPLIVGTIWVITNRRNIVFALGRVSVDEDGVEFSVLSIRIARLKWEECHSVFIDRVDTWYKLSRIHILCFSGKRYSRDPEKGVRDLPAPSDGVIIAIYNEYLWQDIESCAPKKLIKHADARRMSIE